MNQDSFHANRKLIEALNEGSQSISCSENRVLFSQGDAPTGLYIIESGKTALVMKSESGSAVMRLHAGAGSLLGLPAVIGNEPYSLTATADKGSEIKFVTRDGFEKVIRAEPSLYPYVLQVLAAEVRSARRTISNLRIQRYRKKP